MELFHLVGFLYIETPRLLLRDWKEEDLVPFAKMNCDPHVMKYFPKPLTKSESFHFYNRIRDEFTQYGVLSLTC